MKASERWTKLTPAQRDIVLHVLRKEKIEWHDIGARYGIFGPAMSRLFGDAIIILKQASSKGKGKTK
jgi:hypothetical protein